MDRKSVLIVDDDPSIRSSLHALLESEAVIVWTASTIEEAEALIEAERFDLVISDLRLRGTVGMEGFELISFIKARTPDTPVVLFTGHGSPEIEQEAMVRGASDYWEKTIIIPTLVARVKALGIPVGRRRKAEE
jgi:DNA-binding NtrC family response regulator